MRIKNVLTFELLIVFIFTREPDETDAASVRVSFPNIVAGGGKSLVFVARLVLNRRRRCSQMEVGFRSVASWFEVALE